MEKMMANCLVGMLVKMIRDSWLLLSAACVVLCSVVFPVYAIAATQDIYPNPLTTEAAPNSAISLDVMYDVSDADATLTGIGIRVHFNSTKLSFDSVDTTLVFGRLFNPDLVVAEADVSDFDGDPLTDKYLLLAWVDFAGNWPGVLPEKLAAVHFVSAGDFSGSTTVRFSSSDLAGGYDFSSQPATVAPVQIIYPNPLTTEAAPNSAVALDVNYQVSDADATLTGIGIRVHFNSTKLSFDSVDTTLSFGRLFNPDLVVAEADVSDFDGDPLTDKYLLLAWVDFAGNWPGVLPEKLAAVHFVTAGDFSGSTTVRFSSSDLAGGYGFSSQPATVDEAIVSNTFTVGGAVVGLANGESVTLQNNNGDDLEVSSNGNFTFATPMQDAETYSVSVLAPPTCPSSSCFIFNGSGTVSGENVTNVRIVLSDVIFSDSFER